MSNYTTIAEVKAFRPPGSTAAFNFDDWDDADIQKLIDEIEVMFENCLNDFFHKKTAVTIFADGKGRDQLFLAQDADFPHRILSITSVDDMNFERTNVRNAYVQGVDYRVEQNYLQANNDQPLTRRDAVVGNLRLWPFGDKNIRIIGDFGYDPVPLNITKAVNWYTLVRMFGEGSVGFAASFGEGGATEEEWEDYRSKIGQSADLIKSKRDGAPYITGYTEIDQLLAPFINYLDLFDVV